MRDKRSVDCCPGYGTQPARLVVLVMTDCRTSRDTRRTESPLSIVSAMTTVLLDVGGVIVLPDFAPVAVVLREANVPVEHRTLDKAH
jgi:hypothetical protein